VVNLGGTEFLISPNGTASGYRAQMACQMEILAGEILMHEQDFHGLRTVHDGKETKVHTSTLLSAEPWRSRSAQDIPSFMGLTAAFGNPHATFDEVVHMTHVGAVQLSSDGKALP
jgi:hypothetical protein